MKIPHTLKIGGHTITVIETDLPDGLDGEFSKGSNIIKIDKKMSASQKDVTLIHEILHALNAEFDETQFGHAFLESLAQQFYQVLHDNKLRYDIR